MVKIILILALLQYISNFLFGYKSNILGCGIFGMATNKPENLDVNGVHILGIYNIERGKMSCGLTWDGDIQHGLGFDKLYTDFIVDREIKPKTIPIMFGHTRQPSYGATVTADNAHPFGFGSNKDKTSYGMIFCHNGTLKNHKELAKKYDISLTEDVVKINNIGTSYESTRDKIDSEILGEILYKTKKFHVLSEYVGTAALAWTWIDEPNKLYLWSGASKHTQGSASSVETEERPINVYSKSKNSMFFSSLTNGLTVLGAKPKEDLQIDYNTVYVITDGDFKNAEKYKVSRLQAGQSEAIVYSNYKQNSRLYDKDSWEGVYDYRSNHQVNYKKNKVVNMMSNLHEDKPIKSINEYIGRVYSKSLRYWKNGLVINGIYLYIKGHGFKIIGTTNSEAIKYFNEIKGFPFDFSKGEFDFSNESQITTIPFDSKLISIQFHYFIDGVMLKNLYDYNRFFEMKKNIVSPAKYLNHITLSYGSKHPIISMELDNKETIAILEGQSFTGNVTELGLEKVYYFKEGKLVKWNKREDVSFESIKEIKIELPRKTFNKEIFDSSIKEILEFELVNKEEFYSEITEEEDISFINELVMESFEKHEEELNETIIELTDWNKHDVVKAAIQTLSLITSTLKDFVQNPDKK